MGASASKSRTVILPSVVVKTAYVPGANAIHSPQEAFSFPLSAFHCFVIVVACSHRAES
jgi:hypothetical protein